MSLGGVEGAAVNIMVYSLDEATVHTLRTGKDGGGCHWMGTL